MSQRIILGQLQQTVMGSAIIIGGASLISRVLGLGRDRLLSTEFGAGPLLDSYFTAFKIPDFIFNIFVLGIVSAAFIPVFLEYKAKAGEKEAFQITNSLLNIVLLTLLVIGIISFFFTPQLLNILAYGEPAAQRATTILFTRVMLISLLFFGASNVCAAMLHAYKRFLTFALAPIFYNLGIIVGIVLLVPIVGIIGLPLGVVLGAVLHLLVQLPTVWRIGFSYRLTLAWRHPGFRQILKLMPPRAFALGLTQLNILVIFAIASTLDEGSRAVWQFADNLQHFPINIFGVSLALAVFPIFSEALAQNNMERFKKIFSENFRRILFFIIPVSIVTLLLRAQVVRLVYGAGEFDWQDTILTAQTLGVFALSMFAQSLIPLLARAFFAKQDTKTPVIISAIAMGINVLLAIILVKPLGVIGLAFAFSVSALIQMMALLVTLRWRHGDLEDDRIIASTWKIIIAALGMGITIQGFKYAIAPQVNMQTFVGVFMQTALAVVGGGIVYLFIAVKFQFEEAQAICAKLLAMLRLVKNIAK